MNGETKRAICAWWWIARHPFKAAAIRRYLRSADR